MAGKIEIDGSKLVVYPPRIPSLEMKEAGGSWDPIKRRWEFPCYAMYLAAVREEYPTIEVAPEVQQMFDVANDGTEASSNPNWKMLFAFQKQAVRFLRKAPHAGDLLGLSPGLGKTAVALLAAEQFERVLIVVPLSLFSTWEAQQAGPLDAPSPPQGWYSGELKTTRAYGKEPAPTGWVITNYETIANHPKWFMKKWDLVILDESILVKNRDTKRVKSLKLVRPFAKHWWSLSGSPTSRFADDLWSQFHLGDPQAFRSYWRFTQRYCHLEETVWGTNVIGTKERYDLQEEFKDFVFIRDQEQVMPELPEYIFKTINVELGGKQLRAHRELAEEFITQLDSGDKIQPKMVLDQLMRLQEIASNLINVGGEDISAKDEAIEDIIEGGSAEFPMVIWVHWSKGAHALYERLLKKFAPRYRISLISGDQRGFTNDELFETFKSGGTDILIVSTKIGKFGHTLTRAKTVVYKDKTWAADDYVQSIKRVRRIGLMHRPLCITLRAVATVDSLVEENLAGKVGSIAKVSNANLADLLRGLGR